VFILLITIAGCGRKGDPRPPNFKNQNVKIKMTDQNAKIFAHFYFFNFDI
jgi:predicted small lipoprotein YifL